MLNRMLTKVDKDKECEPITQSVRDLIEKPIRVDPVAAQSIVKDALLQNLKKKQIQKQENDKLRRHDERIFEIEQVRLERSGMRTQR